MTRNRSFWRRSDHFEVSKSGEIGDQVLGKSLRQMGELLIVTDMLEGKDRDRLRRDAFLMLLRVPQEIDCEERGNGGRSCGKAQPFVIL